MQPSTIFLGVIHSYSCTVNSCSRRLFQWAHEKMRQINFTDSKFFTCIFSIYTCARPKMSQWRVQRPCSTVKYTLYVKKCVLVLGEFDCAGAISCQADDSWTGFFLIIFLHSHFILQSWLPLGLCHLYVQGGSAGVHIKQARHGVNPTKNRMTWAFNNISIPCLYRIQPWMWGKLWSNRRSSGACYWEVNNNALVYRLCHLYVGGIGCRNGECRGHSKVHIVCQKLLCACVGWIWLRRCHQLRSWWFLNRSWRCFLLSFFALAFDFPELATSWVVPSLRSGGKSRRAHQAGATWCESYKESNDMSVQQYLHSMFVQDSALNVGQTMEQQAFFWCLLLGSEQQCTSI